MPAVSGSLLWLGRPLSVALVTEAADHPAGLGQAGQASQVGQFGRIDTDARLAALALSPRAEGWLIAGESLLTEAAAKAVGDTDKRSQLLLSPLIAQAEHPTLGWRIQLLLNAANTLPPHDDSTKVDSAKPAVASGPGVVRRTAPPAATSALPPTPTDADLLRSVSGELQAATRNRFAAAIGRVAATDAALARRMASVLLLTVSLPSEPLEAGSTSRLRVPLLTADAQSDEAMTSDVLIATDDAAAIDIAQVWMAKHRDDWILVMDDANRRSAPGGQNLPAVLAINFLGRPRVARAGDRDAAMEPLGAFGSTVLRTVSTGGDGASSDGPTISVRIGDRAENLSTAPIAVVRPPGLRIERFLEELTAADMTTGVLRTSAPQTARAHLWYDRARAGEPGWILAIELDAAGVAGSAGVVSVEVWGLTPDKQLILRDAMQATGTKLRASLEVTPPADGAPLNLALVINYAGAGRLTWPRPMLPWQVEPGRLGVDLGDWDGRR